MSEKAPGQAEMLVAIAQDDYTFHQELDGTPFALPVAGPRVARPLRGGRASLRAELAAKFTEENGRPPSSNALGDALVAIEGFAMRSEPVQTHLRVARIGDRIVIDLGDTSGKCVQVTPLGWSLMDDTAGVVFRRTELTGALPVPQRTPWRDNGASLNPLWQSLNVSRASALPVVAWLVAAFDPLIPHPILSLSGEQGVGKTTAATRLCSLVDPSPVPVRTAPKDVEQWIVAAAGSHMVWVDNLSHIQEWFSDALCRASTGDGLVRRALYSNGGLAVTSFRRVVGLTAIDAGGLRGDLADRLLSIELDRIPDSARRRDQEMAAQWEKSHPIILGALLDTLSRVLERMPTIRLDSLPRMADFAMYLAAVDEVFSTGGKGMAAYLDQRTHLAEDVIESDPVAGAIRRWATGPTWRPTEGDGSWRGSAGELRTLLGAAFTAPPKGWPASPRSMSARLKKIAPALRQVGLRIEQGQRTETTRPWVISRPGVQGEGARPSFASDRHEVGGDQGKHADGRPDGPMTVGLDGQPTVSRPSFRQETVSRPSLPDNGSDLGERPSNDGPDGHDGMSPSTLNPDLRGQGHGHASPTPASADIGPCARCETPTVLYGPHGSPLCEECRAALKPRPVEPAEVVDPVDKPARQPKAATCDATDCDNPPTPTSKYCSNTCAERARKRRQRAAAKASSPHRKK